MKLKEQLSGKGDVFENDVHLGKVNYNLYLYQEIHNAKGEEFEGLTEISGKIDSEDADRLFGKGDLILCLEDGRCTQFFVRHTDGDIRCSGGFFEKDH